MARKKIWRILAIAILLLPATAGAVPPSLPKELIPPDMPADVRRLVEQLYSKDDRECRSALWALRELGPGAVSAAPFLATMLDGHFGTPTPNAAAAALARMGTGAFDAVAAAASATGADARRRAVLVMAQLDGPRTVPVIVNLFAEGLGGDAHWAALRSIGGPARDHLFRAVESADVNHRRGAVRALPGLSSMPLHYHEVPGVGRPGREPARLQTQAVVDVLLKAIGDSDADVRREVLHSLARVASCRDKELPLRATLRAALTDVDPAVRRNAIGVVLQSDENDRTKYGALEPLLGDADSDVRIDALEAIGLLAGERDRAAALMRKLLADPSPAAREAAALALGRMRAAEAEGELLAALADTARPVRAAAALALGRCGGKAGIEALMRLTKIDEPLLRFEATRALCERCLDLRGVPLNNFRMTGSQNAWKARAGLAPLPASLRESFPYDDVRALMVDLLEDPKSDLHVMAATALIEGARDRDVSNSILLAALKSPARLSWLVALLHMDRVRAVPDKAFLEPLRHVARNGGDWPASDHLALRALARMGDRETVLGDCERVFQSTHPKIVGGRIGIVMELGESGVDFLLKHLGDPRDEVRELVVGALAPRMDRPQVRDFLEKALASRDERTRRSAEQLLKPASKPVKRPSAPDLPHRAADLAAESAEKGRPKPLGVAPVQAVKAQLDDQDTMVRAGAVAMLGAAKDDSVLLELVKALGDPAVQIRAQAAESLGRLGSRKAVAPLVTALADSEAGVVEAAAAALGMLDDPAAVAPLVKALANPDSGVRRAAAHSLGRFQVPPSADALENALLRDPHWGVRGAAATALGRTAALSREPSLIAALRDEHWAVRRAAHEALRALTREELGPDADVWQGWWRRERNRD